MDLVFINAYTKFYQNSSNCSEDTEEKYILHQSRTITLLFINEFSPFVIPNQSSLTSMSMQQGYKMDLVFINAYTKFYQNSSISSEDIEKKKTKKKNKKQKKTKKKTFLHQSRAITLLFMLYHLQSQNTPP